MTEDSADAQNTLPKHKSRNMQYISLDIVIDINCPATCNSAFKIFPCYTYLEELPHFGGLGPPNRVVSLSLPILVAGDVNISGILHIVLERKTFKMQALMLTLN